MAPWSPDDGTSFQAYWWIATVPPFQFERSADMQTWRVARLDRSGYGATPIGEDGAHAAYKIRISGNDPASAAHEGKAIATINGKSPIEYMKAVVEFRGGYHSAGARINEFLRLGTAISSSPGQNLRGVDGLLIPPGMPESLP